jgi:hypothetical protein
MSLDARPLHEPWASFLRELDGHLTRPTELHCLGGFVVSELYGLERPTADVDVLETTTGIDAATLSELAGKGSALHKRHKVHIDVVTIAAVPEHYEARLLDLAPQSFRNLHLKALERHDLMLAKLERNADRDREDLKRLALGPGLDADLLRERYVSELRFQLGRPEREDLTLDLWLAIIRELGTRQPTERRGRRHLAVADPPDAVRRQ